MLLMVRFLTLALTFWRKKDNITKCVSSFKDENELAYNEHSDSSQTITTTTTTKLQLSVSLLRKKMKKKTTKRNWKMWHRIFFLARRAPYANRFTNNRTTVVIGSHPLYVSFCVQNIFQISTFYVWRILKNTNFFFRAFFLNCCRRRSHVHALPTRRFFLLPSTFVLILKPCLMILVKFKRNEKKENRKYRKILKRSLCASIKCHLVKCYFYRC